MVWVLDWLVVLVLDLHQVLALGLVQVSLLTYKHMADLRKILYNTSHPLPSLLRNNLYQKHTYQFQQEEFYKREESE